VHRVSSAHEEGGERQFAINTEEFIVEDGRVSGLKTHEVIQKSINGSITFEKAAGTEKIFQADLVLLALGFTGPESSPLIENLGLAQDERGNVKRDDNFSTNQNGIFVCGDMGRGQSLIVWAIAEGRSVAHSVDTFLRGESKLPTPVAPADRPLT
jgi:glutamate synthase (NADPH/NADH) small chain